MHTTGLRAVYWTGGRGEGLTKGGAGGEGHKDLVGVKTLRFYGVSAWGRWQLESEIKRGVWKARDLYACTWMCVDVCGCRDMGICV